ncbi:dimethylsulfonioproprionate lyase family protein [Aestuariivirga sp.]|uniref:dimethylsulfonioproprionate lyase family protein n=1 Tax=Aestuariivirga sp. TaxID=2650926 RepID=UPI00391C9408
MAEDIRLFAAPGERGSGLVRYGAAMVLHQEGTISAEQLECYRVASADDGLDPVLLLRERGLTAPATATTEPETLVRALVDAADAYCGSLAGPGIAEVRQGLARFKDGTYTPAPGRANAVVAEHMPTALQELAKSEAPLAGLLAAATPHLDWITYDLYDIEMIGEGFAASHAYCSIIGDNGSIRGADFDFGLFLIAPHVLYRDHRHAAPELYAPLTGPHGWRFRPGTPLILKHAHDPVWNEPFQPHLTKVGSSPFLCLFCWTRDTDKPAEVLPAPDWAELEALKLDHRATGAPLHE